MTLSLLQYPKPYEYESLASYFHRLAEANSCQVEWLLHRLEQIDDRKAKLKKNLNAKKLNRIRNSEIISSLAQTVKVPNEVLINMSIYSLIKHILVTFIIMSKSSSL